MFAQLTNPAKSPIQRYLLVRDITFDFFTGDIASDLGRLQSHCVFQLPHEGGFLHNISLGKTLRVWMLLRARLCFSQLPLSGSALSSGFDTIWTVWRSPFIRDMFFVLPPTRNTCPTNNSWVLPSTIVCVPIFWQQVCTPETPHSFRTGLATTLTLGFSVEDIAAYLGWKSVESARQYSRPAAAKKLVAVFNTVADSIDN